MRELAISVGANIEELAKQAGLNSQTLYRKKHSEAFARKATLQLIEAANKIALKNQVRTG
jgi:transposase-like protein